MDKCQHDYDPDGNYCVRCDFAPTRAVMASEMIAFQQRIKALEDNKANALEYLNDVDSVVPFLYTIDGKEAEDECARVSRAIGAVRAALDAQEDK